MTHFRAFWPITDPARAPHLLIAEAEADLARVAAEAGTDVADLADLRWSIEGGHVCLIADVAPGIKAVLNRRLHRCPGCGCQTRAKGGICRTCKGQTYEELAPVPAWRRRGLIWVAA